MADDTRGASDALLTVRGALLEHAGKCEAERCVILENGLRAIDELGEIIETLEKRLRHSEFHRTANRRRMRRLGKYQGVLEKKIVRQRQALREFARPKKRASAHERAADLHRSLRSEP